MSQLSNYDRWKLANPPEWDREPDDEDDDDSPECRDCHRLITPDTAEEFDGRCWVCDMAASEDDSLASH